MATEKKVRQQLSKITNTIISPARIRRIMDDSGLNQEIESKLAVLEEQLLALKKKGGPAKPKVVPRLAAEHSADDKAEHVKLQEKYNAEFEVYNHYSSTTFEQLKAVHVLCKNLYKIQKALNKKDNAKRTKELADLTAKFNTLSKEPALGNYQLGVVVLTNPNSIQGLINKLREGFADLHLLLEKDELSRSRIRFNDPAAVALAATLEVAITEFLEFGMKNTLESGRKTLQPDQCVNDKSSSCTWYFLFRNLPHFRAIIERQRRKAAYDKSCADTKRAAIQKAKKTARKEGKKYKRPDFNFTSFNDEEVANKFATKTEVKYITKENKEASKTYYQWFGIDLDEKKSDVNFQFYVQQICRSIMQNVEETEYMEIKISSNVKKLFSDLIMDFVARISPQIMMLLSVMDIKTVDADLVKTILKLLVYDNYHASNGKIELNAVHQKLFDSIDKKIAIYEQHHTTRPSEIEASETKEPVGHEDDPTDVSVPATKVEDLEKEIEAQMAPKPEVKKEKLAELKKEELAELKKEELKTEVKKEEPKTTEVKVEEIKNGEIAAEKPKRKRVVNGTGEHLATNGVKKNRNPVSSEV